MRVGLHFCVYNGTRGQCSFGSDDSGSMQTVFPNGSHVRTPTLGVELAPNLNYMGKSGIQELVGGLRVAFLSGRARVMHNM